MHEFLGSADVILTPPPLPPLSSEIYEFYPTLYILLMIQYLWYYIYLIEVDKIYNVSFLQYNDSATIHQVAMEQGLPRNFMYGGSEKVVFKANPKLD